MKKPILHLSPLALILFCPLSYAETYHEACDLDIRENQCASVEHFVNKPFKAKDDFEKYKLCNEAKFDLHKVQKNCEFDQYLANAKKTFEEFQKTVSSKWDQPNFSDQYSWVSYSPTLELKREVNFEKNVIKVTTIAGEEMSVEELKEEIIATSQLTIGEAQKADVFTATLIEETKVNKLSDQPLLPVAEKQGIQVQELEKVLEEVVITESVDSKGNKLVEAQISFPPTWLKRKEKRYFDTIEAYSKKYELGTELVLSIIKTESAFDPTAVSHIPAFGLMQIAPSSAGLDATSFLFGEQQLLRRDYLFDPEKNIEVGTAYLHLLRSRYFKGIEDEESLKYCVIAAYNGGMGPIYRMFGGKRSVAIKNINQLTPEQVFSTIQQKHAAAETRNYLKKVHKAELSYEENMI
ncbi:MAG: DUF3393 domain-containing protein [Vibrionaceae bacterium]|nr:DUF3393 domain-containing protein [Vibrionaceae bacterium]